MIMAVTAKISTITTTVPAMTMRLHGRPVGAGKDRSEIVVSHQYRLSASCYRVYAIFMLLVDHDS